MNLQDLLGALSLTKEWAQFSHDQANQQRTTKHCRRLVHPFFALAHVEFDGKFLHDGQKLP